MDNSSRIVLVTGANGQLGSELRAISHDWPQFQFEFLGHNQLDITHLDQVDECFNRLHPDFVVNCAAYNGVDRAETEALNAKLLNTNAVENLTAACRKTAARLVHISTDYVFDGQNHTPYLESDKAKPLSVYARTKFDGERAVLNSGVGLVIRTAWLYSSFGNNFVKTMLRLSASKSQIGVVVDQVGSPTYANDLAHCILQIISSNKFVSEIFHFTNEGVCSWYDLAHEVVKLSGNACQVVPITTAQFGAIAPRPSYSVLSKKKIRDTFGMQIPHWRDALNRCYTFINSKPQKS